jgi:hypothetical protein
LSRFTTELPRIGGERICAGHDFVDRQAEGVDIARGVGLAALQLLRRHVFGRAGQDALERLRPISATRQPGLRQAEIRDHGARFAAFRRRHEHHIRGFEIPVRNAGPVGRGQPRRYLLDDRQCFGGAHSPLAPQAGTQRFAAQQLHREKRYGAPHPMVYEKIEHAADVRVGDLASQLDFFLEARDRPAVGGNFGADGLQRDVLVEFLVLCLPDFSHAAPAEQPYDPESAGDHFAGGEGSGVEIGGTRRGSRIRRTRRGWCALSFWCHGLSVRPTNVASIHRLAPGIGNPELDGVHYFAARAPLAYLSPAHTSGAWHTAQVSST